jgi:hypothetical protein
VFRYDDRLARYGKSVIKLPELPGLEIRIGGNGKQLQSNCPPTIGVGGTPREWNGNDIIADLPQAVFAFLDAAFAKPEPRPVMPDGDKTVTPAEKAYANKALDNECHAVAMAPDGEQNSTLNKAAFSLGQLVSAGALNRSEVERRLLAAAAGYISKDGEPQARKTIWSGLNAGENQPRDLSRPEASRNGRHSPTGGEKVTSPPPWPLMRLTEQPSVEAFPIQVLPLLVARLVELGAQAIGCPPDFLAVSTLVVAGGVIGRSASLLLKDNYFASATVFAALVGPLSDGKTPALKAVARAVRRIDDELADEHDLALQRWKEQSNSLSPNRKKVQPLPKPRPRRIDIDDATMEVLPLLLADNPRGLLMVRDELTAFVLGMNQYKSGGKGSDRSMALKLWSGDAIKKDRVNDEDRVPVRCPHPSLSLVGGITPDMLKELVDPKGRADGFLDRILFAYPDQLPAPEWSDHGIPQDVVDDWCSLVASLWVRAMDVKDYRPVPHVVRFTAAAKRKWRELFATHVEEMNDPAFPPYLRRTWGKFRGYAGRLVLILTLMWHAADPTADSYVLPEVQERIVDAAFALLRYFKSHARRVRSTITRGLFSPDARSIVEWIKRNGRTWFRGADIRKDLRRFRDHLEDLATALDELKTRAVIRPRPEPSMPAKPGPKPSPAYDVHPDLLEAPEITTNTTIPARDTESPPNCGNGGNSRRDQESEISSDREVFEL